ncbi:MAG TPA: hypothetical protein VL096_09775 [Pirellulaceae bacterium]|nr:hypothetical protein [Pirellulaceae bacterium]
MNSKRGYVLALSIGLGVVAAVLNWLYLIEKGKGVRSVALVGVANDAGLQRGDVFNDSNLVPVEIPYNRVGNLAGFAVLYNDRQTVIGMKATRNYANGELVLRGDLQTPPPQLELQGANERAMWIPVDTRTFVPTLVMPGDLVTFVVSTAPRKLPMQPTEDAGDEPPAPMPPPTASSINQIETIGPFPVLSLGNRLGSSEVMRSAGIPQLQENVMTIRVTQTGDQLDAKAQKLWAILRDTDFRQVGVLLHPRPAKTP